MVAFYFFDRNDIVSQVVHVRDSFHHERAWYVLHIDNSLFSIVLWYRHPKRGEILSIQILREELSSFSNITIGLIVFGDMNVHEQNWLEYSTSTSI